MELSGFTIPSLGDLDKELARKDHLRFMDYTWRKNKATSPFVPGFHTEAICNRLNQAFEDYRNYRNTYLMITVVHRHGKSDIISRYLPPHFLGEFPQEEVLLATYGDSLAQDMSKDARSILTSSQYQELYPEIEIHPEVKNISSWALSNGIGKTTWAGLNGSIIGKGANLLLIDDFAKNRTEIERETVRDTLWTNFRDVMTRLGPRHIVILLATSWHVDDLFGRIERQMAEDPDFPRFEKMAFPAKASDYTGKGQYPNEFLFEERYPASWYKVQYATLGKYGAAANLDCCPTPKGGNLLSCVEGENWSFVESKPEGFGRMARAWDLASSSPKTSDDPDWTVGVKGAIKKSYNKFKNPMTHEIEKMETIEIYIDDIVRFREEATLRNQKMMVTAAKDGAETIHLVEAFGAQKDTINILKNAIGSARIIKDVRIKGDKLTKVSEALEVPFALGNVYINKKIPKHVLDKFFACLEGFPSAAHDDDADALAILVTKLAGKGYDLWWER